MDKKIVKSKSLQQIQPNTKYMGCTFYLDYVDGENFEGVEFDNCSFRGSFRDWGRDQYGLWLALTYKNIRQIMRWIKPGTFLMGSPHAETNGQEDEVLHEVTLNHGFWLADTACTQELWEAVMGENPSYFKGKKRPVECISWEKCTEFMDKWNRKMPQWKLCFPTEAQWEYACRAGTTTAFSFGNTITNDEVCYNSKQTVEVKSLPCNNWGLYEMHGNVCEWCSDCIYSIYRVARGGCWRNSSSDYVRSAYRRKNMPSDSDDVLGFRFCLGW